MRLHMSCNNTLTNVDWLWCNFLLNDELTKQDNVLKVGHKHVHITGATALLLFDFISLLA